MTAGTANQKGDFPQQTFNARVVESLKLFAEEKRHDHKGDD
jgi:hypothetical protein